MPVIALPLDVTIIALVALILLIAGYMLGEFIQRTVTGGIHIPGMGTIDAIVRAGVTGAMRAMTGALEQYARNIVGWITAAPHVLKLLAEVLEHTIWVHALALRGLIRDIIPRLQQAIVAVAQLTLSYAMAFATKLYDRAIAYVNSVRAWLGLVISVAIASVIARITAVQAALLSIIAQVRAQMSAYALSLYHAAIAALAASYAALGSYVLGQVARLEAYARDLALWAVKSAVDVATDWARRYADALVARVMAALVAATAIALAPAWPRIIDVIDEIARALPESLAALLRRIGALPRFIPRDLALAIGAIAAIGAVSLDWISRCGLKLCRDLSGVADEFAALQEELIIADIVALVAVAATDPTDTASDIMSGWLGELQSIGSEFAAVVDTV
jgi:hypothetical protein